MIEILKLNFSFITSAALKDSSKIVPVEIITTPFPFCNKRGLSKRLFFKLSISKPLLSILK